MGETFSCISNRQEILENFVEKEQEILKLFPTQFIIIPNRIKIVNAFSTQTGDQLFIATMQIKQQTRNLALQPIFLNGPDDENVTQLVKMVQRRRFMTENWARNLIKPLGITVRRDGWDHRSDSFCLVLDIQNQILDENLVDKINGNFWTENDQIQLAKSQLMITENDEQEDFDDFQAEPTLSERMLQWIPQPTKIKYEKLK